MELGPGVFDVRLGDKYMQTPRALDYMYGGTGSAHDKTKMMYL